MSMACLVLASGLSRRFGHNDKLLAEFKGQALLAYCLNAAKAAPFDDYFVVTPDPDPRAILARNHGFNVINNPNPEFGQGASLALGAGKLIEKGFDATCILLGDMPFITSQFLKKLIAASEGQEVMFSRHAGRFMPPAIFKSDALHKLTTLTGDQGARALDFSGCQLEHLNLPPELAIDIDSARDFDRL